MNAYYSEINATEAEDLIRNNQPLILDIRDAYSYKAEHIDGAMQAHEGLVEHLIKSKQHDRALLIYWHHGNSSKDLAEVFGRAGYKQSFSLKGGYTAWKKRHSLYTTTPYCEETAQWLLEQGFDNNALNITNDKLQTPLIIACQQGRANIANELISAGADVNAQDNYGNTALWAACYSDNSALISSLAKHGADFDHQNKDGVTALIYAASAGKERIVVELLSLGANKNIANADGFIALDVATTRRIVNALRNEQAAVL